MTFKDAISLGRISNLPTVWTNVVAATYLSAAPLTPGTLVLCCVAMSLMYTGGMYLNDAFDRKIDARQRPERPIPSGRVSASTVFTAGFAQLGVATLLLAWLGANGAHPFTWRTLWAALALAGVIVLYDVYHKHNPLSPLLMGLCRVGVYVGVAVALTGASGKAVLLGAAVLLSYLIGLTYTAKQENLARVGSWWPLLFLAAPFVYAGLNLPPEWVGYLFPLLLLLLVLRALAFLRLKPPMVPKAVVSFIAGISLVDATLVGLAGHTLGAALCVLGFGATLLLQRWVSGT